MIVILTLANKPQYLPDALASVEAQTRRDFEHVVELDDGSRDWEGRYPPAVFFNERARAVADPDDYLCWLSDDDLLLPNYVEDLAGKLDEALGLNCVYGGSRVEMLGADGTATHWSHLPILGWPTYNKWIQPASQIDGGQFMVRRSVLGLIKYPYMNESPDPAQARLTDGYVMNKIANVVGIYPVKKDVMINRLTPLSAHCRPGEGERLVADWRTSEKWRADDR